jgi:hypothetical protein
MAWTDLFTRKAKPLDKKAPNSENPASSRDDNVTPTPDPKMLGSGMARNAGEKLKSRRQQMDDEIDKASR